MKVKFWTCGNCGHEEPITDNDLQELNPVVSSAGAIKISCPNCGAYTISKPFDSSCMAYMNQKGRRYITLEELQQGKIEAINLPRIEINGERGYDLKGVRDCTYTKAIT